MGANESAKESHDASAGHDGSTWLHDYYCSAAPCDSRGFFRISIPDPGRRCCSAAHCAGCRCCSAAPCDSRGFFGISIPDPGLRCLYHNCASSSVSGASSSASGTSSGVSNAGDCSVSPTVAILPQFLTTPAPQRLRTCVVVFGKYSCYQRFFDVYLHHLCSNDIYGLL